MNKKKIGALLVAGALTLGVVGGTFAWFTSQDSIKNIFTTGGLLNPSENPGGEDANGNGVEIWEDFKPEEAVNTVPGDTTTKLVQVQNTTTYDSFIRVKITPKWTVAGPEAEGIELDPNMIKLNFGENLGDVDGKWLDGGDGYYYYMAKVASGKFTNPLLESVTLSTEAGNEYRDAKFEVLVEAESIQADNDAHNAEWTTSATATVKLDYYETTEATGVDKLEGVTVTDTDVRE